MKPPAAPARLFIFVSALGIACGHLVRADDEGPGGTEAGHSLHSEAFNEGPRQSAVLMNGTGKVKLKISSKHPKAQAFFNQGVGQLHGFWFFEAERSFRQVAFYDTNCAMAYWGMAMANVNNSNRAAGFIKLATNLKTNASAREKLWIDAYDKYFTGKAGENQRHKDLVSALENIIEKYPKELEAKTFLAFRLWENEGEGIPITSRVAADALMSEVLAIEPLHPIHHARIHTWNDKNDARALNSAARCGQSAPAIAHMWHMPGHTYSKLYRYDDAAWQQEAAARTDHDYMMTARILPDQIHNFAHNNQWLCTDLLYCGRVDDAIELAKNMVELPRHPKYNTLNRKDDNTAYDKNNGSSMLGRNRLFDAFLSYELWGEMLALADTFYLEPTELPEEKAHRCYALALADFAIGNTNDAQAMLDSLQDCYKELKRERFEATEKAEALARKDKKEATDPMIAAMKAFNSRLERVEKYRSELQVWSTLAKGHRDQAKELLEAANDLPKEQAARLWSQIDTNEAVKAAKDLVKSHTNEAPALALATHLLWQTGEKKTAIDAFKYLRAISSRFDLSSPIFARLSPVAVEAGYSGDWRCEPPHRTDTGKRPPLESLGPFRWQPYDAPSWTLADAQQTTRSLNDFRGRPVLVVFYLGAGCAHCIEQLNLLGPAAGDFEKAGISIVAISTDSVEGLNKTVAQAKQEAGFPFPLLSNKDLSVFKAYRTYDDFEKMPLHGTFLVDAKGKVRWQDISYEPFREMKFLLDESKRSLGLDKTQWAHAAH